MRDTGFPAGELLAWNSPARRVLPWRCEATTAWGLLLAEIMLKRELGERVVPVWQEAIAAYPTPSHMLSANRSGLVGLLKPLGLQNQRAHALKHISAILVRRYHGEVPDYQALLDIRWVGPYTAGAIEVFHRGGRVQLLDPNILRVGSRFFGIEAHRKSGPRIGELMLQSAPDGKVAEYYYAVLDLGALCCRRRPLCGACPISESCAELQGAA